MDNLIRYCCGVGLHNFVNFKLERNSHTVMREHFVSNKDVEKYDLAPYVQPDKYGRYKIPKYILRKLSNLISDIRNGYLVYETIDGRINRKLELEDVQEMLLNPNGEVYYLLCKIQEDLDKDLIRNRMIKIWNIKKKMKLNENTIK